MITQTNQSIHISTADRDQLQLLLAALSRDPRGQKLTQGLRDELARATVVDDRPADLIGLDCTAEIVDLDTGEVDRFTLSLPARADLASGRLSVLTPLGTAMLGYAAGDEFSWSMPGGVRRLRIARVAAAGATTAAALA